MRWEARSEWPLVGLAALFLAAYAWPILHTTMERPLRQACHLAVLAAWLLFGLDYGVRLVLAEARARFLRRTAPELLVIVLPVLRPLRLLRLVSLVAVLGRTATASFRGRVAMYVGSAVLLVIFVASLAVLDAERGQHGANISSFGDALWWSVSTVTTVGYGDRYPVTGAGRLVATGLMICGIALLGVVTASIATWFLDRVRDIEDEVESDLQAELIAVQQRLARMESMLLDLVRTTNTPT
ncbi:MAG TPA: potassium channel family protein [Jatrophihabitans sp.]|jgi:voltage-gated potassium channel